MATQSAIEWTEVTWNPVTGCDRSRRMRQLLRPGPGQAAEGDGAEKYQNDGDP